jgi:hypothetical protein
MDNKIFMHFPIEIEKGEDGTYKRVIVKGKASTPHQDKQGEWIDPMGCDIDDFKRISDDHIKGNSGTIGEIIKAHKDHEAVWIDEAELYPSLPQVQHIVKIADELKKRPNSKMQLSFSIEGSATERDSINPKRILKAKLTGAAVTLQPINQNATAELFAKSLNYDDTDFDALEKSDNIEQKRYLYEWKDSDGVEYKLTKSFEIEKGTYVDDAENRKLGRVGQHYGGKGKEESKDFKSIPFEEKSDKILNYLKDKLNIDGYEITNNSNRLLIRNKRKESYIDIMPAERVLGGDDVKGKLYVQLFDKSEVKSTSLADPRAAYQTTSARSVVHKKTNIIDEFSSYSDLFKKIDKFTDKVSFGIKLTQKSTTAELEDDDSEDVLKKEELKKKTVSLIAKAIKEKRISKEKGKKMLKHFLNQ